LKTTDLLLVLVSVTALILSLDLQLLQSLVHLAVGSGQGSTLPVAQQNTPTWITQA
jgi:hypothetical protein